jgi:gas vesicle protein
LQLGFAIPMAIGTLGGLVSFIAALLLGPETRGKVLTAELEIPVPIR